MAIKAGQFLTVAGVGNGFVVERIQSGGASALNINEEKIYELGNYRTVATVRDIPDLTWDVESFDVSTDWEALLVGQLPTSVNDGDEIDFLHSLPLDIISPFKDKGGSFDIVRGLAVPYLTLETLTYRFGVDTNATQQATLRGDSIYWIPGSPRTQSFTVSAGANQTYNLDDTALTFVRQGENVFAVSVCAKNTTDHTYRRLFHGDDYTNTSGSVTVFEDLSDEGFTSLSVVYGTAVQDEYPQSVHSLPAVKPAALRGKDIEIHLSDGGASPVMARLRGVQDVEVSRRVTLERDEELGNPNIIDQDYDEAEVEGSFSVKSRDAEYLWDLVAQVANVPTNQIAGPDTSTPLQMEVLLKDPDTGDVLKTLYVPDARIVIPSAQGRVREKLTVEFPFTSDSGELLVYKAERP